GGSLVARGGWVKAGSGGSIRCRALVGILPADDGELFSTKTARAPVGAIENSPAGTAGQAPGTHHESRQGRLSFNSRPRLDRAASGTLSILGRSSFLHDASPD